MSEQFEIKDRDSTYVRKVIGAFINEGMAARISPINEDVVRVVGKMVAESKDCSEWMDYVPKPVAPVGARPGIKWSLKRIRKIGKELVRSDEKHKFTCSSVSALKFRTRLEEAQHGML